MTTATLIGSSCPLDPHDSPDADSDVLVVKHDATNNPVGKWLIGQSLGASGNTIAAGTNGSIYVGGASSGLVDFDPGPGVVRRWVGAYSGAFVLKLDSGGGLQWVRPIVDGQLSMLAPTPDGGVIGIGWKDVTFLTRLSAGGAAVWSFPVGGPGTTAYYLASSGGRFAVAGASSGNVDMDPGPALDLIYGDITFVSRYGF